MALILADLYAFNWTALNRMNRQMEGQDFFSQLMAGKPLADFFHSQPGLFRVQVDAAYPTFINLGDMFEVQTTWGQSATTLSDYLPYMWLPKGLDLLNVRYIAVAGKEREGQPVYNSGPWKVYENPSACPRAWVVYRVLRVSSSEAARKQIERADFDTCQVALIEEPLETELTDQASPPASVRFDLYQADRLALTVKSERPGLLVLSEMYYPGWEATVNGRPARIHKVNGLLRGIVVSEGENRIYMRYRPRSVQFGGVLTAFAFLGTALFAGALWARERTARPA